jgi:DNA-binding HxlR family transcriptional regulator
MSAPHLGAFPATLAPAAREPVGDAVASARHTVGSAWVGHHSVVTDGASVPFWNRVIVEHDQPVDDGTCTTPTHVDVTTTCPSRDRVGDKWSLLVIELLGPDTRRFSEPLREIEGISPRMLTRTLRRLERDGPLTRTVHPVVPPRVEYALTSLGHTLSAAIQPLVAWSRSNRERIAASRDAYDAEAGPIPAPRPGGA